MSGTARFGEVGVSASPIKYYQLQRLSVVNAY
jgi:hypothetical protein